VGAGKRAQMGHVRYSQIPLRCIRAALLSCFGSKNKGGCACWAGLRATGMRPRARLSRSSETVKDDTKRHLPGRERALCGTHSRLHSPAGGEGKCDASKMDPNSSEILVLVRICLTRSW